MVNSVQLNTSLNSKSKNQNSPVVSNKLLLFTIGAGGAGIFTHMGILGLKEKVSYNNVIKEALENQRIDAPQKERLIQNRLYINYEALSKQANAVQGFDYKAELERGVLKDFADADHFIEDMNKKIKAHNLKCDQWKKDTLRKYLSQSLKNSKQRVLRSRIGGGIFMALAAATIAGTAYLCSK